MLWLENTIKWTGEDSLQRKLAGLRCEYLRSWTNKIPFFHPLGKWCRARVCVDALGFGQNVCNSYPINRNIYNERLKLPGLVTSLWWRMFVRLVSTKCYLPPSVPLECLHSHAACCPLTQTEKFWRVSSVDAYLTENNLPIDSGSQGMEEAVEDIFPCVSFTLGLRLSFTQYFWKTSLHTSWDT